MEAPYCLTWGHKSRKEFWTSGFCAALIQAGAKVVRYSGQCDRNLDDDVCKNSRCSRATGFPYPYILYGINTLYSKLLYSE
jgi:hypothetical protein